MGSKDGHDNPRGRKYLKKKPGPQSKLMTKYIVYSMLLACFLLSGAMQYWSAYQYASDFPLEITMPDWFGVVDPAPENPYDVTYSFHNKSDTLVIFSGPRRFAEETNDKSVLYWKNFHYFMKHGITCEEDVVVVVGHEVFPFVEQQLAQIRHVCRQHGARINILSRDDHCYDMEAVRLGLDSVVVEDYKYFVIMNDGVAGPRRSRYDMASSWTHVLTDHLTDTNKMVGISINCKGPNDEYAPHINSFLYAFDKDGLQGVKAKNCIYDCTRDEGGDDKTSIIKRYEIGMSKTVLESGFTIHAYAQNLTLASHNISECQSSSDLWHLHELYRVFGEIPAFDELHFFKTTRFVPDGIAKELEYRGERLFPEERPGWEAENVEIAMGGRSTTRYIDPKRHPVHVLVLISKCVNLAWVEEHFKDMNIKDYTIINMCGGVVKGIPASARLLNIAVVAPDYVYASLIKELVENTAEQKDRGEDILFFLNGDDMDRDPYKPEEVINAADVRGFACRKRPYCSPRCSSTYQPTVLHLPEHFESFSVPRNEPGSSRVPRVRNLGEWFEHIGATVPDTLVNVCYGRSFAVRRNQLMRQSLDTWKRLEQVLAAPSFEDNHYAERAWAALMSAPIPKDVREAILEKTERIMGNDLGGDHFHKYDVKQWQHEMRGMLLWKNPELPEEKAQ